MSGRCDSCDWTFQCFSGLARCVKMPPNSADELNFEPSSYTDHVVFVRMVRQWLAEQPSKTQWTLTRSQIEALLSVIDSLTEDT